jgi:hypothetical protein
MATSSTAAPRVAAARGGLVIGAREGENAEQFSRSTGPSTSTYIMGLNVYDQGGGGNLGSSSRSTAWLLPTGECTLLDVAAGAPVGISTAQTNRVVQAQLTSPDARKRESYSARIATSELPSNVDC